MVNKKNTEAGAGQMEQTGPVRASGFNVHYVNHLRAGISDFDIQLTFGLLDEIEPGKVAPLESAKLVMSPGFAKATLINLTETIRQYELRFGQIPPPKAPLLK